MSLIALSACGTNINQNANDTSDTASTDESAPFILKSRATLNLQTGEETSTSSPATSSSALTETQPIVVTNAASSNMSLDATSFNIPTISNALLSFGYLQLKTLLDNDIKVCGNGHQKCSKAIIRMYTAGTALAGIYNSVDNYGIPLYAGQTTFSEVGLSATGAVTLQTFNIPNNRNTVQLADFPNPKYNIQADFSDAGTGTFSTTLVVEYGLQ
jgi:hypothetical protein